ncbi:MAG: tRNA 5-methoxyuridine(34)/uridine 5-oxyacetic acid(34) synthase CmoB [Alcanivoracaceae bacterium]|uniref:tRNA 5-methoxyuridine(34)/uridine 5-oxyacetic acid(34) synthase CmoB n=1 Tax=Alcanivorax sp. MD8A TaxID=1177157 RepID=UPI000C6AED13|nr:tRNA 5-methoxyuridine(34)/uridine 5-oxyacetic acid(34) synthase CmoB [Alcanivorax sp. MD8A]MAX56431.1 tRNA 5-methoxyuridine(34)/uridine 5-oxyacetic acid(34) synthase CmoB [Alcanivoracaceae bacterium]PNE01263.1 tRNA mo(5)U34 methyltransferase [Alcanivorax sp. MD8A]
MLERYLDECGQALGETFSPSTRDTLLALTRSRLIDKPHGDLSRWMAALQALPPGPAFHQLGADTLTLGESGEHPLEGVKAALEGLIPWRKGPFNFFGVQVETEWRSDWKWQRVAPHLSPLDGRRVLDVGCGSGYHCWRMAAEGASQVVGIDPTILFLVQYLAVKRYAPEVPVWFLPLRMEELPAEQQNFDTVFSMGVLYHRRSPLDHILELKGALFPGGELVLETLVVEGDERTVLMPEDRYAVMRNVFFLPSVAMLTRWLERCGFTDVRCVDEAVTTVEEQHATPWMRFQSLPDFLDPDDPTRTREGYPAPRRAVLLARKP